MPARIPAQVHEILLRHGKIPDPHISRNAADSVWVGEKDWAYACVFKSPTYSKGPVSLRFGGLDTLATAYRYDFAPQIDHAFYVRRDLRDGQLPFGEMKNLLFSDIKAQGKAAIDFFTEDKIITERYRPETD